MQFVQEQHRRGRSFFPFSACFCFIGRSAASSGFSLRSIHPSKFALPFSSRLTMSGVVARSTLKSAALRKLRVPVVTFTREYHEKVVEHYNNPKNVGSFDKNDPDVGTGLVGAPACGDVMKLQIKVDKVTGKIVDSRFKTFGCGSAIASSSVASEWIKGRGTDEVLKITNSDIAKHLSLPPVKLHCSMLAEDAIKAAVKDYESKRPKVETPESPEAAVA